MKRNIDAIKALVDKLLEIDKNFPDDLEGGGEFHKWCVENIELMPYIIEFSAMMFNLGIRLIGSPEDDNRNGQVIN